MCRLFGMTGGDEPVAATFWLLEAPDSLSIQSRREPDGTGLGVFDATGAPVLHKWPIAAYEDREFAEQARHVTSPTFVAHIRFASTGAVELANTHPFEQRGRLFAHNGVVEGLDRLDEELGEHRSLVAGDTDSERVFALITKRIEANDGDVTAGLVDACRWIADHLPLYALNIVLTTPEGLWALRYPETHRLVVLERAAGGARGDRHLDAASAAGTVRVRSGHLASRRAVVVASEPMDEDPGWRPMAAGELVHVGADLVLHSQVVIDRAPAQLLTLDDLRPQAAASQHPQPG
jgi:predicted glutamine amidotransferase